MRTFLKAPLLKTSAFLEAEKCLTEGNGPIQITGCVESQKVQIMAQAGNATTRLVVTYDEREARLLLEDYRFFEKNVFLFPEKDFLFYQADIKSNTLVKERMRALRAIHEVKQNEKDSATIITTMAGAQNALPPIDRFEKCLIPLSEGSVVELKALLLLLTGLGYERTARVENPGEYALHGGILDLFDITSEVPYRIEFWDDEIDTIRSFNAETQVSENRLERITIYPATELFLNDSELHAGFDAIQKEGKKLLETFKEQNNLEQGASLQNMLRDLEDEVKAGNRKGLLEGCMPYFYPNLSSIVDYLPKNSIIYVEEPARLEGQADLTESEYLESFKMRLEKGLALSKQSNVLIPKGKVFNFLNTPYTLAFTGLDVKIAQVKIKQVFHIDVQPVISYQGNLQGVVQDLRRYASLGFEMVLLSASGTRGRRLAEELRSYDLKAYFEENPERNIRPGELLVTRGSLHRGFIYPHQKYIVFTENDLYEGEKKKRKNKPTYDGTKIRSFSELSVGDYVVHESYGIGIYRGIKNIETDGIAKDYMEISYGNSGTLYIPVTNLDVVQKYASQDAKMPHINRLDSPDWKKTKARVKAAVEEVAEELVNLYALRENGTGHAFREDTVWQREFEELFPFEETDDQLKAIEDTKADMESTKIMDRLICGDVGFGKTEVAIRAAFKAVQEGKQVAYLVPTTILAQQHYHTFTERMANYPITVELLSRFRTKEQQTQTLKNINTGMTDIVIGTHRILSKDVHFKDLGLLIIDEEQRFGVKHKEQIKQLKNNVDVLTLTATPIPRTLHMSMIGVRDMSVLSEPPVDRQAIQTYVMEYSEELVREAIQREIGRGGQVYYVYNRVQDIEEIASKVQALVPDAVVSYAHGKMDEHTLENRMLAFVEGEIDVLVSTTIIETGLDIPNVNTIIIHDAERYGLSQLYQLRGRVGRSTRQAYAFVMYRKNRILNEEAQKRLEAIRQFTELGSGIKIAMQDLEIRGAGTVLGNAQSGHMALVGYDLYCKMLSEAVHTAKTNGGLEQTEDFETLLDIKVDAYVPSTYIENESLKLEVYKRISLLQSEEDKDNLLEELLDRFGDVPKVLENLTEIAVLRAIAKSVYISEIKGNAMELTFKFVPFAKVKTENIPVLIQEMKGAMQFIPGEVPGLKWHAMNLNTRNKVPVLECVKTLLNQTKELLI